MRLLMAFIMTMMISTAALAEISNFSNESELGIAVANGNSDSQSYNFKQENKFSWGENAFKFNGRYLNTYSDSKESARYILGALRYERELSSRFAVYAGQMLESDKFSGYDLRHSSDLGFKYYMVKEETVYWTAEAGYRYTNEKQTSGAHAYKNQIRAYSEVEKKWTPTVTTKYWIEYLPNMDDTKDYEINTEASISAALNNIFSIKTAYLLRYDRVPPPTAKTRTDTLLTTALVAKF